MPGALGLMEPSGRSPRKDWRALLAAVPVSMKGCSRRKVSCHMFHSISLASPAAPACLFAALCEPAYPIPAAATAAAAPHGISGPLQPFKAVFSGDFDLPVTAAGVVDTVHDGVRFQGQEGVFHPRFNQNRGGCLEVAVPLLFAPH